MKTREVFLPTFSLGIRNQCANSCLASVILTASLPVVMAAARRCNFHSDTMQVSLKKLSGLWSQREWEARSLPGSRFFFFLLREQPLGGSPLGSCGAHELACSGRGPGSHGKVQPSAPHSQRVGNRCPALRESAPPSWPLDKKCLREVSPRQGCPKDGDVTERSLSSFPDSSGGRWRLGWEAAVSSESLCQGAGSLLGLQLRPG